MRRSRVQIPSAAPKINVLRIKKNRPLRKKSSVLALNGSKIQNGGLESRMPRRPNFEPIQTDRGWMISIPPAMSGDGQRRRKFYRSESEAQRAAKTLRASYTRGERGGVISHALALDAAAAAAILEPLSMSLTDAAKEIASRASAAGDNETLRERWVRAQTASEGRWSARYARDIAKIGNWVPDWLLDRRCATIDAVAIRAAVMECGAAAQSTIEARSARVSAILHYKERHRRTESVSIMSIAQCAAMLRACDSPDQRRAVALLLFAGIRPSAEDGEISRLRWEAVGSSEIYVSAEVAKTGTDRHVPLTPRLRRLLRGHPVSGPVLPSGWRKTYRRLRQAAGISAEQDVTRHTFASHFLAAFGDHAAKQAMGHSAGSTTLFRHYRRAVTEAGGRRFFGVV
jgi:integrase